jgi:uncharacterized DUF497 family protein
VVATSRYSSLFLLSIISIRLIGRFHVQEFLTIQSQAEEGKRPTRCRDHCLRFKDVGQAISSQTKPIQSIRASLGEGATTRTGGIKRQTIKLVHTKLQKSHKRIACVLDQSKQESTRLTTFTHPTTKHNLLLQIPIG